MLVIYLSHPVILMKKGFEISSSYTPFVYIKDCRHSFLIYSSFCKVKNPKFLVKVIFFLFSLLNKRNYINSCHKYLLHVDSVMFLPFFFGNVFFFKQRYYLASLFFGTKYNRKCCLKFKEFKKIDVYTYRHTLTFKNIE